MKKKLLAYAFLPVMGLSLITATAASAHGMFSAGLPGLTTNVLPGDWATRQAALFQQEADLLGVSVDDIKTAWASGQSYMELAKEKGISQETIQARLKDAATKRMKDQLSALVSSGVITQAQADQRLAAMQSKMQQTKRHGR